MRRQMMIYGATGYTGRLIASRARRSSRALVLAGRDGHRLRALAATLDAPSRAVALDEPAPLDRALADICVVINAASPYADTARPLIEACLRTGTHYLDITGELPIFRDAHSYDDAARYRGIMLMPGVGLGIVASDCLAMHVSAMVPNAKYLRIGLSRPDLISRGTLRAAIGLTNSRVSVRRNGQLISVPVGRLERAFDYGDGERASAAVSWADVFTAFYSTGIRNIETYIEADFVSRALYQVGAGIADTLRFAPVRQLLNIGAGAWPDGPTTEQREATKSVIVAEAEDSWRRRSFARLETSDGYSFTAGAATAIAARVVRGEFRTGFQTPGRVYGADFVLGLEGSRRVDLDRPSPRMPSDAMRA